MSSVQYDVERAIATITLDSPANRNALSAALVNELGAALELASRDASVRAIVLTHTGPTFCAGTPIADGSGEDGSQHTTHRLLMLLRAIVELPKPVIARVDGHARSGGVGLVAACDLALGGPGATFAFGDVRLGLAPAVISLVALPRLTSRAASRYLLTGEILDGQQAADVGLLTEYTDDLDPAVARIVAALLLAAPLALAETKALTTAAVRAAFDTDAYGLQQLSARLSASDQAHEGRQASLAQRAPNWVLPD